MTMKFTNEEDLHRYLSANAIRVTVRAGESIEAAGIRLKAKTEEARQAALRAGILLMTAIECRVGGSDESPQLRSDVEALISERLESYKLATRFEVSVRNEALVDLAQGGTRIAKTPELTSDLRAERDAFVDLAGADPQARRYMRREWDEMNGRR